MTMSRLLLAVLTLGIAADAAAASEIYRCKAPGGAVSYQQQPCAGLNEGDVAGIATVYPDYTAARDLLLAREAAMDERLLRRLEIEAAERIARDQRIAREAELQAQRERAARQGQGSPMFIVGVARQRQAARRTWP